MKTRVTFRVDSALAEVLRELPNQTRFVEEALREALRAKCPACDGTGRVPARPLRISNFKAQGLAKLDRDGALQLKELVALARRIAATQLMLERARDGRAVSFAITRADDVMLRGVLRGGGASFGGTRGAAQ